MGIHNLHNVDNLQGQPHLLHLLLNQLRDSERNAMPLMLHHLKMCFLFVYFDHFYLFKNSKYYIYKRIIIFNLFFFFD